MPYQEINVVPELFLSHNGVNVYRTYVGDDIDQGPKQYWFTVKPMEPEEDNEAFDVREMKVPSRTLLDGHPPFISLSAAEEEQKKLRALWEEWQGPNGEVQVIRVVLKDAIDAGLIVAGEDNVIEGNENDADGFLDWEVIGKSMKAANIPGDIMPGETESQFVARIIMELDERCGKLSQSEVVQAGKIAGQMYAVQRAGGDSSQTKAMRIKTWRGLRPVTEFDEVEIHAMCEGDDAGDLCQSSDCPGESPVAYTVFLHCVEGGIETVQDFRFDPSEPGGEQSAREEAEMLAEQLYDMLRAAGTLLTR